MIGDSMLVLGLDLETTGRDVSKDQVIEVGAILWDTDKGKPLKIFSEMVWYEDIWDGATSTEEDIERLIHISYDELCKYGKHPKAVFLGLKEVMETKGIAAVVAHNGLKFDKPLLLNNIKKWDVKLPDLPWIDTINDIPYDPSIDTRKLPHLAAEHGFINPFAHRAIFDVLTMLKIFQSYDTEWVIKMSKEPSVTLIAKTTPPWKDEGKSNAAAKARGFRWNGEAMAKVVRESQVKAEKENCPLEIKELSQ